jgi:uncharacterized protein
MGRAAGPRAGVAAASSPRAAARPGPVPATRPADGLGPLPPEALLFPRHLALWERVAPLMDGRDLAHDALHLGRVYRWALRLAPEAGADPDLAGAAALVHDLDPTPKHDPDRPAGGERSSRAAEPLLAEAGYDARERAPILAAVAASSWSRGLEPAGPLGAVLQDADRLDAIGAVGIARVFACHQSMAAAGSDGLFYHPGDPFAEAGRDLDDRRHALDHFAVKLLKLADGMHTPTARAEAARRHEAMLTFLSQLWGELENRGQLP